MQLSKISVCILLTFSVVSFAGVKDFNSILSENDKIQKQLSKELQQQLETRDLGKPLKPDFKAVGEEVLDRREENVVADTSSRRQERSKKYKLLEVEKKSFKRLSQELKEVKEQEQ